MACPDPQSAGSRFVDHGPRSHANRWALTFAATLASTYALDAVAAAAGVALLASGLLGSVDIVTLTVLLGASYVAWGFGLRAALAANWDLLERTGASTNVVSKAGYDVATARGWSETARKLACGTGYVVVELAKEAPYYVGAFGAAALTDAISSREALVFLAGANLGAACYEAGLAWTTRRCLASARAPEAASFERDWSARDYLKTYYSEVEADERRTIAFLVDALKRAPSGGPALFVGVGPTLHHVFAAARGASEIHLADYLRSNLGEIERWMAEEPGAHDWRPFVGYTLRCEGGPDPSEDEVMRREQLTRRKITRLLDVDIRSPRPLGRLHGRRYATVVSAYCADSITSDRAAWEIYMRRISDLVAEGGTLVVAALRGARSYRVGRATFPSAGIDEDDMRSVLTCDFDRDDLTVEAWDVPECAPQGYAGIVLASARNRRSMSEAA